jgi:hypothetical protein
LSIVRTVEKGQNKKKSSISFFCFEVVTQQIYNK